MSDQTTKAAIAAYLPWKSATFTGARVTLVSTTFEADSNIEIASAVVVDVARKPSGEVDLLIVCRAGVDPAADEHEIGTQLIAAAQGGEPEA